MCHHRNPIYIYSDCIYPLFYLALAIIGITVFTLTIGQWLPVEFAGA